LEQRRTILLAVVAGTPKSSASLARILSEGFLNSVKQWLDEVLSSAVGECDPQNIVDSITCPDMSHCLIPSVGGVDFLLHLLSCIVNLPVTKSTVKNSGMGKAIGIIEKHKICKGTPNEAAIGGRVQEIKEAWNASVKALKATETTSDPSNTSNKRPAEDAVLSPSSAKRIKSVNDTKKPSSFSSLLKKVAGSPKQGASSVEATNLSTASSISSAKKRECILSVWYILVKLTLTHFYGILLAAPKKTSKRVKWSDHFGGALSVSDLVEGEEVADDANHDTSVTWSDRKKRDRLREKELLAKAK
jgi:hypothetical protein